MHKGFLPASDALGVYLSGLARMNPPPSKSYLTKLHLFWFKTQRDISGETMLGNLRKKAYLTALSSKRYLGFLEISRVSQFLSDFLVSYKMDTIRITNFRPSILQKAKYIITY